MIEDISDSPPRMSATESMFHTERKPPANIRGVRSRTRPEFYKESGMMGNGTVSGQGVFEGYIPGATAGAHGNAMFEHAYSGSHQYPGQMSMNQSMMGVGNSSENIGSYTPSSGDYGSYTNYAIDDNSGVIPALTESYNSNKCSCVDVAAHASDCPVCSQLYSHDNTVMYVIIAVLILIIVLLFIKLLDCR